MSSPLVVQQKKLANLSIVLGSLYIGAAAIFLFGVFAAASVRRLLTALGHSHIHYAHYAETLGPHPHILLTVCCGGRYRNCVWFSANDSSLHAQGNDTVFWDSQFRF